MGFGAVLRPNFKALLSDTAAALCGTARGEDVLVTVLCHVVSPLLC